MVGNQTDQQIADQLGITADRHDRRVAPGRRAGSRTSSASSRRTERRVSEAVAETITDMNTRHLKEYQLLQTKGIQALQPLDPRKAAEAQAMVDAGIRGERLVRGEPTEVREVRALMQANVQVLELVVADVIKVLLEAGRIDGGGARQFADVFADRVNEAPFRYAGRGLRINAG